jgi:hypothetical protein
MKGAWSKDNWCAAIVQPQVPGVAPYQCHMNAIQDGLCRRHLELRQKREAREARLLAKNNSLV